MYLFNFRSWYAYDTKGYLQLHHEGFVCPAYNNEVASKLLIELPKTINKNDPVDLYAYAYVLYNNGDLTDKNKAFAIFDKLCDQDYLPAYNAYAVCLFEGVCVPENKAGAVRMYKKAADLDFAPAMYNLGYCYLNGIGIEKNVSLGTSFIENSAQNGYGVALHALGLFYYKGEYGYPQDYYSAFNYLKEASYRYRAKASYLLAEMYLKGLGCEKNIDKCISEHELAASLDYVPSQKFLGDNFYYGQITEKNMDRAYSNYLAAANNGDDYAMYSVGYMIITGKAYWIWDKSIGKQWLIKASNLGNKDAKELLKKI